MAGLVAALVPVLAALAAGCAPPPAPVAPAPATLTTARTPTEVVQLLARELTVLGFDIATSDAAGGVLVARRARGPRGNADILTCRYRAGSIAETHLRSTLTVHVAATPTPSGSAVVVRAAALAQFPTLTGVMALPDSDTDCASRGVVEAQLVRSVGARAPAQ